jgi:hypothetical protein
MNFKGIAKIAAIIGLGAFCWYANPWRSITHQPGVLVKAAPVQSAAPKVALPDVEDWKLVATAEYKLHGLVLGTKRYHSGLAADLVPIDVAIGWGRMSDQSVLDQFTLSMSNRFFFYKWENEPAIPVDEIMSSAANNHIISANADVRKVIASLIPGHIVTLRGYLVNAMHPDGANWNSSLRRDDTGNGACELFYVTEASAVESLSQEMDAQFAAR